MQTAQPGDRVQIHFVKCFSDGSAESQERSHLQAVISKQVLRSLGEPEHLQVVQVRPLWGVYYRVNGPDSASITVAHSYFLETDGAGNILASTPAITRLY
jgi:hypothetical protein